MSRSPRARRTAAMAAAGLGLGAIAAVPGAAAAPGDTYPENVVAEVAPNARAVAIGSQVFFTRPSSAAGGEALWVGDGTREASRPVFDFGAIGTALFQFTPVGSRLFFTAFGPQGSWELWSSTGSAASTIRIKRFETGDGEPEDLTALGDVLYFSAEDSGAGRELWRSDGVDAERVVDINTDTGAGGPGTTQGSYPSDVAALGGSLYFSAEESAGDAELWRYDPSIGARRVEDIRPGAPGSYPSDTVVAGNALFFTARTDDGRELWTSDGTRDGTRQVADIRAGATSSTERAAPITAVGPQVFFAADDGVHGKEVWVSDGTPDGTRLVADLNPTGSSIGQARVGRVGSRFVFSGDDGSTGGEPWATDGTPAGTVRLRDIAPGAPGSLADRFTTVGGTLFFAADESGGGDGDEVWATDGTPAGTLRVTTTADAPDGSAGAVPLTGLGNSLFYRSRPPDGPTRLIRITITPPAPTPTPAAPSNAFDLPRGGTANTAKGRLTLRVALPGPGTLSLAGTRLVKATTVTSAGGTTTLRITPTRAGLKKLRAAARKARRTKRAGALKVAVTVTFTPTGGAPRSAVATYRLKKR